MKLCIDCGHGYANRRPGVYDSGAVSGGVSEADIVLQWGVTGKWVLSQAGIAVWLTRDDDTDPDPVGSRDDRAEQAGCTHLLSLHCNAFNGVATGTETYYRDSSDRAWASKVQTAALVAMMRGSRGLKKEGDSQHSRLAIFDFDGPACLLEIGFIDHPIDRERMLQREARVAFWQSLLPAISSS